MLKLFWCIRLAPFAHTDIVSQRHHGLVSWVTNVGTAFLIIIAFFALLGFGCLGLGLRLKARADQKTSAIYDWVRSVHRPDDLHVDYQGRFVGFRLADRMVIFGQNEQAEVVTMASCSAVDVRKNGVSLTKTNRSSQMAGAAVGGLLFGSAGAIVGGVTGSSSTSERLKSIGLRFMFDHDPCPSHYVEFGTWPIDGVLEDSLEAVQALAKMDRFQARAVNAMRAVSENV